MSTAPRLWFTADTHFGHDNIVPMTRRPFMDPGDIVAWRAHKEANETLPSDLKQRLEAAGRAMDEALVDNWNAVVKQCDDVWHLGDFHYKGKRGLPGDYLRRLNGRLHLVRGNHDDADCWAHPRWVFSEHYARLQRRKSGIDLVLSHYAMRVWDGSHRGSAQLFGHSHGMLKPEGRQCDVGVDCWGYRPVSLEQVMDRIESR